MAGTKEGRKNRNWFNDVLASIVFCPNLVWKSWLQDKCYINGNAHITQPEFLKVTSASAVRGFLILKN